MTVATADPLEGETFGSYRLITFLSKGGYARVYRALDVEHDRIVAIKVQGDCDERHFERFRRECEIILGLRHPHIVRVYAIGMHHSKPWYAMRYCDMGTLGDWAIGQDAVRFTEAYRRAAIRYACQILDALHYAHQQGIVHRDIKPANVLIDPYDPCSCLVADFGIAWFAGASSLTKTDTIMGTAEYMAPEQCYPDAYLDGRADQYSLGCVLYHLLAGAPPFSPSPSASNPMLQLMEQHARSAVPSVRLGNPQVSEALAYIIHRSLAKDPDDRWPSAAHMAAALRPFTEGKVRDE